MSLALMQWLVDVGLKIYNQSMAANMCLTKSVTVMNFFDGLETSSSVVRPLQVTVKPISIGRTT